MDKRTGTIITIALAVIFGCCGLFSCIGGIGTLAGAGNFEFTDLSGNTTQGQTPPEYGIIGLCLSIIFFAIPAAAYFLLARGKNGATPPPVPPAM